MQDVISITDPLKLLRTAMSHTCSSDYSVASDIMIALRMSSAERVQFLSREIIAAISKGPAPGRLVVKGLEKILIKQFQKIILTFLL